MNKKKNYKTFKKENKKNTETYKTQNENSPIHTKQRYYFKRRTNEIFVNNKPLKRKN